MWMCVCSVFVWLLRGASISTCVASAVCVCACVKEREIVCVHVGVCVQSVYVFVPRDASTCSRIPSTMCVYVCMYDRESVCVRVRGRVCVVCVHEYAARCECMYMHDLRPVGCACLWGGWKWGLFQLVHG